MTISSTSGTSGTSGTNSAFSSLSVSPSGSSGPALSFNGVISGTNTQAMIQALMYAYELPQINIQNQANQINANLNDYQTLSGDLTSLQTAADAISQPYLWNATTATSSNTAVATATTGNGAQQGTLVFNVNQLAQAEVMASSSTVSSTSSVVANGPLLMSVGAQQFGVTSISGSGLATGSHTVDISSGLSGGSESGTANLSGTTSITSANDTITAYVNGALQTLTIAAGTYTQSQLAAAIQAASVSSGTQTLQASFNDSGQLQLNTSLLGTGASLQITGGTALSTLGLSAQSSASVGTAGSITLDGGTAVAVNNVQAGSSVTVAGPSSSSVTLGIGQTGLSQGTFTANEISTGGGSLSSVVSAINGAGAGVSASAVQTGTGAYLLQLSSQATGTAGAILLDTSNLSSSIGTMNTITSPQDAQIQVGGSGGYLVNSSSNTLTNVMPGVTINLVSAQASGSSPVTITVSPDGQAMAGLVQSMVTAANKALSDINTYAGYNAATKTAGPLMGDPNLNAIMTQIEGVIAGVGSSFSSTNASSVGLDLTSSGQITFNQSTFLSAYQANPTAVTDLFTQGGSLTASSSTYNGTATLVSAGDGTQPGSYPIVITHSATQANDLGLVSSTGTITNAETITVSSGSLSASYAASAGESFSSIAAGLNTALSTAGIGVGAQDLSVSGGSQLSLTSGTYGSSANFSVTTTAVGSGQTGLATTANTAQSFTGTDVAGTINGVAATGAGQTLTAPYTDPTLQGLALNITASGITSSTSIGSFSYQPGIAGGMAYQANAAVSPTAGTLTDTISNLNSQITNLQQQYNSYTPMLLNEQKMLQQEFSTMETQMSGLVNQGSWLASQIKNLP